MYATAAKKSESATSTTVSQKVKNSGHSTLQRQTNKHDTESLSRLLAKSSSTGPSQLSSKIQADSASSRLSRLIKTSSVQPKLKVSKPNDRLEQEADQMADTVMTSASPGLPLAAESNTTGSIQANFLLQRQAEEEEESAQAKPLLQRQPAEEEEESVQANSLLQRQPEEEEDEEEAQAKSLIQRQAEEEEEESVQAKPLLQRQPEEEEEAVQAKFLLQRQPEEEEEPVQAKFLLQRQAEEEEESAQAKPLIQRQAEEEEESAQANSLLQRQAEEEEEEVQAKSANVSTVSSGTQSRLRSTKGAGSPLPSSTRALMEQSFGSDFSYVRIHTDSAAVQMSEEIGAQAFTHGSDIYFNEGRFDANSSQGKRLLAHELSHTIQQGASPALERSMMKYPEIQQQEAAAEELIDVEAEIAASEEEATAAQDPKPAEQAKQEAEQIEQPEPEEQEVPEKVGEGPKEGKPKKKGGVKTPPVFVPKKKEEEEAETGEVGQYLEQESGGVCAQAAGEAQVLAENEKTHGDAGEKLKQTEDAVKPPEQEGQAQSNAKQVQELDEATPPEPDDQTAKDTMARELEKSVPTKVKQLNEFKSRGKAKVVGNKVLGKVKEDASAVQTTYNEIENAPPAKPQEGEPVELPPEEIAPETPVLNLGKGAVPQIKEEHTDFTAFDQKSDALLGKEGISDDQLKMVDEGDLFEARKERQGLKQKVTEQPAHLQEFAQNEVNKVEVDLQQKEKKSRAEMRTKRKEGLTASRDKQKKTKTALELKREAVTKKINSIYEGAKTSVTTKLNNLERDSLRAFDRGQAKASAEFEDEVKSDINSWKRKRYSGFWGPAKWLKDKLVGIDHFPEVKRAFDKAKNNFVTKIDQLILDITKASQNVIKECREELAAARKEIKSFVDGLRPELKATGQQAMEEMKSKLAEMDKFIDRKKKELAQKLCDKKDEAIKKIDEKIEKMKEEMSGALSKLGNLLLEAALKFFKWALKKAGYNANQLMGIINKGKAVIKRIVGDPIGFIRNIVNAVKTGIYSFQNNIKKHLVGGLINWLTGAMSDVGIQLPAKFDLKGIISIVMQILGLTWANIRQKLVKRLGEKVVSGVEKTIDIVKKIVVEGPMALWQMIKAKAAEIKAKVMEGIRNWAIVELVKQGIIKLVSFLNPAGAIVQAILAIYNTVMFFVENWNRIVQFVKTVFNSIADMAMGKISAAAAAVERAMASTIPIILNFLARLLNLSGIGKAIKNIILKIRKPIDKVLNKAIDFIVKKAKELFRKGKAAAAKGAAKVKELLFPQKKFKVRQESHTIKAVKSGKMHGILIQSPSYKVKEFIKTAEARDPSAAVKVKLQTLGQQYEKWAKMKEDTAEQKRTKEKEYSPIAKLIIGIMQVHRLEDLPTTNPAWSSEPAFDGKERRAKKVVADPLTKVGDEGGRPSESIPGWNTARKESKYRVHLLHEKLHGPGVAKNLVAASKTTNERLRGSVERFELTAVDQRKIIQHEVEVNYESDPDRHWKRDVVKHIEAKARDKETGAVIGSYSGDNY